jgi:hypothetical protein
MFISMKSQLFGLLLQLSTNKNDMKSNAELQIDVQNAIKWEPLMDATEIGVIVQEIGVLK